MLPQPDPQACLTLVYPCTKSHAVRRYQVQAVKEACAKNTLVCLPTGTGKTLIAAVVMLNFHRWFPTGKIVFLAPTRPLVAQQIKACRAIARIPQEDTVELTGSTAQSARGAEWTSRRVFFCTPQSFENDVQTGQCPSHQIVCLVVDEAHKAQGDYAYVSVVKMIGATTPRFRVLALTATPGDSHRKIQQVLTNLRISSIVSYSEHDPCLRQYMHGRETEVVRVEPDRQTEELRKLSRRGMYKWWMAQDPSVRAALKIQLDPQKPLPRVSQLKSMLEKMKQSNRCQSHLRRPMILLVEFITEIEKLGDTDIKSFQSVLGGLFAKHDAWQHFAPLWQLLQKLAPRDSSCAPPKMERLLSIVLEHFMNHSTPTETRAIVFAQYRAKVAWITSSLNFYNPELRAHSFVGQAAADGTLGMNQNEQKETMRKFREGDYNVLVATSIGEEGLDIGEVDLIVQYDCLSSHIRTVQRTGRTGRKRGGRVIQLLSIGDEEEAFKKQLKSAQAVQKLLKRNVSNWQLFGSHQEFFPTSTAPEVTYRELDSQMHEAVGANEVVSAEPLRLYDASIDLTEQELIEFQQYFQCDPPRSMHNLDDIALKHGDSHLPVASKVGHSVRAAVLLRTVRNIRQGRYSQCACTTSNALDEHTLPLPRASTSTGYPISSHTGTDVSSSREHPHQFNLPASSCSLSSVPSTIDTSLISRYHDVESDDSSFVVDIEIPRSIAHLLPSNVTSVYAPANMGSQHRHGKYCVDICQIMDVAAAEEAVAAAAPAASGMSGTSQRSGAAVSAASTTYAPSGRLATKEEDDDEDATDDVGTASMRPSSQLQRSTTSSSSPPASIQAVKKSVNAGARGLTEEQRSRIAHNRKVAQQRRLQREHAAIHLCADISPDEDGPSSAQPLRESSNSDGLDGRPPESRLSSTWSDSDLDLGPCLSASFRTESYKRLRSRGAATSSDHNESMQTKQLGRTISRSRKRHRDRFLDLEADASGGSCDEREEDIIGSAESDDSMADFIIDGSSQYSGGSRSYSQDSSDRDSGMGQSLDMGAVYHQSLYSQNTRAMGFASPPRLHPNRARFRSEFVAPRESTSPTSQTDGDNFVGATASNLWDASPSA